MSGWHEWRAGLPIAIYPATDFPLAIFFFSIVCALLPLPPMVAFAPAVVVLVVPGLFLVRLLDFEVPLAEFVVYAVGAGLAISMISVALGSSIMAMLGVTDVMKEPTIYAGLVATVVVLYLAVRRTTIRRSRPRWRRMNQLSFIPRPAMEVIAITLLPVAAVSGSLVLNDGGTIGVAVAFYLSTMLLTAYLFLRKGLSRGTYVLALYAIGAGLILALSMRSEFVVGADVHDELWTVRTVLSNGYWLFDDPVSVTSTVTSLTVFGPLLVRLTGLSPVFVFKIGYPLVMGLIPVTGFLLFRRVMSPRAAFLTTAIAMSHLTFWGGLHSNNRSGIAILFMMLFLLVLLSSEQYPSLAFLFLAAMITAHYTVAFGFVIFMVSLAVGTAAHQVLVSTRTRGGYGRLAALTVLGMYVHYDIIQPGRFMRLIQIAIFNVLSTIQSYVPRQADGGGGGGGGSIPNPGGGGQAITSASNSLPDTLLTLGLFVEFGLLGIGAVYVGSRLFELPGAKLLERFDPDPSGVRNMVLSDASSRGADTTAIWIGALVGFVITGALYVSASSLAPSRVQGQFQFVSELLLAPALLFVSGIAVNTVGQVVGVGSSTRTRQQCFVALLLMVFVMIFPLQTGLIHVFSADSLQPNLADNDAEVKYVTENDIHLVSWYANYHATDDRVFADRTGQRLLRSATMLSQDSVRASLKRHNYATAYVLRRGFVVHSPRETRPSPEGDRIYDAGNSRWIQLLRAQ